MKDQNVEANLKAGRSAVDHQAIEQDALWPPATQGVEFNPVFGSQQEDQSQQGRRGGADRRGHPGALIPSSGKPSRPKMRTRASER